MAKRRTYDDKDRARVLLALEINRGNIKATSRDTGVPYMTVKNWKDQAEKEGVPPAVREELPVVAVDFTNEAVAVRDAAITKIRDLIPQATIKDLRSLATLVGILDDKVRLAQGLATSRKEEVHVHLNPEVVGKEIGDYIREALDAAQSRHEDITDVEFEVVEEQAPAALLSLAS